MPRTDSPAGAFKLEAGKSRGRPPGPHGATVEHGRRLREVLATGTPLNFVVEVQRSLGIVCDAKTLRRQLHAADEADGRSAPRRSMRASQAVSYAIRRLREHDAEHPEAYPEEPRSPEAFETVANRLELVLKLCRAQAAASESDVADLRGIEGSLAHLRAEALPAVIPGAGHPDGHPGPLKRETPRVYGA